MRDIRHGHVVGKMEGVIPLEIPVHHGRTESPRSPFLGVLVDCFCAGPKNFFRAEQSSIMVQSVDANFAACFSDLIHYLVGNRIPDLGDQFECGLDSALPLDLEHGRTKILTRAGLDIVSHNRARVKGIGPIPDKRYLRFSALFKYAHPQPVDEILNTRVNGPVWKTDPRPILKRHLLQMAPDLHR